jgi:hypothetical protein
MKGVSERILNIVSYIGSILLFLLTAFIIIISTPHYSRFIYEYKAGEPWLHENLIAETDFPVKKSDQEKRAEADSIVKMLPPVFYVDTAIPEVVTTELIRKTKDLFFTFSGNDSIDEKDSVLLEELSIHIEKSVLAVYLQKGIIAVPDSGWWKGNDIYLKNENGLKPEKISFFYTPAAASEVVTDQIRKKLDDKDIAESFREPFLSSLKVAAFIRPGIVMDTLTTREIINSKIATISDFKDFIKKGQIIVRKGDIVNDHLYNVISSYAAELDYRKDNTSVFLFYLLGRILVVLGCLFMLFLFLFHFKKDVLLQFRKTSFILSLILIFYIGTVLLMRFTSISIYVIPFALIPIIIRSFYDNRLAVFIFIIAILLISFIVPNSFEFMFLQTMAGLTGIFAIVNLRRRGRLFFTAFLVFLAYGFFYLAIEGLYGHHPMDAEKQRFVWFGFNSVMILAAIPLTYLYEKVFAFLSDMTLMELTDTNNKLLRMLAEKAPGTFQHSLQVANLAEEVIVQIGGNPLLARAGALYHDLGKTALPRYYIENQMPGQNPHDELDQLKSAEIIIGHISYGVEMAKKYGLPDPIIDFIRSHHGTSRVEYFYKNYQKKYPDTPVDEKKFQYKGKLPFSRETAAVMMADAVEAASRSLKVYNDSAITELVDRIIQQQIDDKQLNEADITFRQITIAKDVFRKKLRNIYHARLEYPK